MIGKPLRRPLAGAETRLARVRIQGLFVIRFSVLAGYEPKNASEPAGLDRRCCASVKRRMRDRRLSAGDDRRKWGILCSGGARTRETMNWLVKIHNKKIPIATTSTSIRECNESDDHLTTDESCRSMRERYRDVLAGRSKQR